MSKYNILKEKLKKVFVGFHFDEQFEECTYIDLDKTDKAVLEKRYFGIDSFPMQMKANSAYGVLDTFWDLEKDKTRYLKQEEKFLRALLLIMSYSDDIIISDGYFHNESKKYLKKVLNKKELEYLKQVKDSLFDFKEIDFDYDIINSLMKLALRERNSLTVYMIDLEIALDINSLYSNVYLGLNGNLDIVKYICNVEGLYIRDRYLEE
jgi:hypothetical protein